MLDIKINAIQLRMDESDLRFSFCKGETEWSWTKDYRPKMECKEGTVFLTKHWRFIMNWYRTESEKESAVHLPDLR